MAKVPSEIAGDLGVGLKIGLKRVHLSVAYRWRVLRAKMALRLHAWRNKRTVKGGTQPKNIFFHKELQHLLGRDDEWLSQTALEYCNCPPAWLNLSNLRSPSPKTDGFGKTLDVAEGFALWALVKHLRPRIVVELGTLYGISARLWKEALKAYVPEHELILCDLEDKRQFIGDGECTFLKGDARQTLPKVFASKTVDLLHNDAHPYSLIRWSVEEGLRQGVQTFTFHDIGRGERGPFRLASASLSSEEKLVHNTDWATCGTWERHVMGEIFDPKILYQNSVVKNGTRIRVFDSLFGFGVVIPSVQPNVERTYTKVI